MYVLLYCRTKNRIMQANTGVDHFTKPEHHVMWIFVVCEARKYSTNENREGYGGQDRGQTFQEHWKSMPIANRHGFVVFSFLTPWRSRVKSMQAMWDRRAIMQRFIHTYQRIPYLISKGKCLESVMRLFHVFLPPSLSERLAKLGDCMLNLS